jgi:hypothetical protein
MPDSSTNGHEATAVAACVVFTDDSVTVGRIAVTGIGHHFAGGVGCFRCDGLRSAAGTAACHQANGKDKDENQNNSRFHKYSSCVWIAELVLPQSSEKYFYRNLYLGIAIFGITEYNNKDNDYIKENSQL